MSKCWRKLHFRSVVKGYERLPCEDWHMIFSDETHVITC